MKRTLLGIAAISAVLIYVPSSAGAADLTPLKAPPPSPPPPSSWSGCYAGAYAGGASGSSITATEPASTGGTFAAGTAYNSPFAAPFSYRTGGSAIGGGTLGCNWQWQPRIVVGIEGELGALRSRATTLDPNSVTYGNDTIANATVGSWYGVVAGRLGWAVGPVLFYAKGGGVFTQLHGGVVDACSTLPCGAGTLNATGSTSVAGGAVGGGIEWAFAPHWSVKAEYLYLGINNTITVCGAGGATAAGSVFCGSESFRGISTGKIGLNFKFGPVL